ncbi:MAG: hypothetical protein R3E90_02940 [Marinicella sp.]
MASKIKTLTIRGGVLESANDLNMLLDMDGLERFVLTATKMPFEPSEIVPGGNSLISVYLPKTRKYVSQLQDRFPHIEWQC